MFTIKVCIAYCNYIIYMPLSNIDSSSVFYKRICLLLCVRSFGILRCVFLTSSNAIKRQTEILFQSSILHVTSSDNLDYFYLHHF